MQWGVTLEVLGIDVSSKLYKQFHVFELFVNDCEMQGGCIKVVCN